jgi:hypothetical protein
MDKDMILLRKDGCTYISPDQDPRKQKLTMCGCQDFHGESLYCKEHYPVIYSQGTALRKRHKDARKKQSFEDLLQEIVDTHEELYG